MSYLLPYIVFPGNCKEAMEFYRKVLGGEMTLMQTFGDSPMEVPAEAADRIFNSELKAGNIHFKASDDLPNHQVTQGTNISLFAVFPDEETQQDVFEKLSEGGKVLFPINGNFGMLKDRYGVQWMLVHER